MLYLGDGAFRLFLTDGGVEPVNQKSTECCGQSCEEMRRTVCDGECAGKMVLVCADSIRASTVNTSLTQRRCRECFKAEA